MILVTGASGFLGQHLVHRLSVAGKKVRALYQHPEQASFLPEMPGVTWAQCDLLDVFAAGEMMQDIDEVYHCAAIVSFQSGRREEILHNNTECAANIVNAALDAGIRKLVHVSSVAALGRTPGRKTINEDAEWEESTLNSVYGQSKHEAEMEIWRGIGEGLNAVIVNPGIIIGEPYSANMENSRPEAWDESSAKLIKIADDEFPFYTGGATSFADVTDVARAMETLMDSAISNERFVIAAGNFPYREIFTKMALALGRKPPHIRATPLMTGILWRASALNGRLHRREPVIARETALNAQQEWLYENDKLLRTLPEFIYTLLNETIARVAAAYKRCKNVL